MKNYAFIFARGGSKGLPGKNIKPLAGKPLIQYSIESAVSSALIDKVFVSTDDNDIAEVTRQNNVEVIDRPVELATDTSPEWLAWRHAIQWVYEKYGEFETFVSLPATSPLRDNSDIGRAITHLWKQNADICISVTEASRSPFFNMVKESQDGYVELVNKTQDEVIRRQDAPKVFDITTVVYAALPEFILKNYGLFSGRVTSIEIPKERAVDIDDIYDFKFAEVLLKEDK